MFNYELKEIMDKKYQQYCDIVKKEKENQNKLKKMIKNSYIFVDFIYVESFQVFNKIEQPERPETLIIKINLPNSIHLNKQKKMKNLLNELLNVLGTIYIYIYIYYVENHRTL